MWAYSMGTADAPELGKRGEGFRGSSEAALLWKTFAVPGEWFGLLSGVHLLDVRKRREKDKWWQKISVFELGVAVGQRKDQGMCEQQKQRACWCLYHNSAGSVSGGGPAAGAGDELWLLSGAQGGAQLRSFTEHGDTSEHHIEAASQNVCQSAWFFPSIHRVKQY